jgi:predicted DNA-binding transcriptional regulator AlpA
MADVEYLNKSQLQAYLGISKSSVEKLMRQGLPHIKLAVGRSARVIFRKVDIDKWLESKVQRKK